MNSSIKRLRHRLQPYFTLENGVLLLALIIAASLLWSTMIALQKNFMYEQEVTNMEQAIELAELEKQSLELEQGYFRSEEYLDLSARERLNKARPGEHLIVLPDPSKEPSTKTKRIIPVAERSNFEQWLFFFFGERNS